MRISALLIFSMTIATCSLACAAEEDNLRALQHRVESNLRTSNIAALDDEAYRLRSSKARFKDGRWKLSMLYGAIGDSLPDIVKNEKPRERLESQIASYAATHPKSTNAGLFRAMVLEAEAWDARGSGYANTVSPEGWRAFSEKMGQARTVLDGGRQLMADNPAWYTDRIDLAIYTNESPGTVTALLRDGIRREPHYLPNYFAGLVRETPRWGGSTSAMVSFINRVALASPVAQSEGMYARLVWFAEDDYPNIGADPGIDWKEMARSFDAILGRFPSERNAQKFFFMACMHSDKPMAIKLLPFVHAAPLANLLNGNVPLFGKCVDWSKGDLPEFMMREHDPETGKVTERLIR
jgi:hypothetical protein